MPNLDPRVTAYIQNRAPFARPILRHLRKTIRAAAPELEEGLKWGMAGFLYRGRSVCGFGGFKTHCALWFWQNAVIVDGKPKGYFGQIQSLDDLPSTAAIRSCVRKTIAAIKAPRPPHPVRRRPRHPIPAFVRTALRKRGLQKAYDARPPYQRNDYVGWINQAKREETKQKRLAQMLAELADGTRYMNMKWKS